MKNFPLFLLLTIFACPYVPVLINATHNADLLRGHIIVRFNSFQHKTKHIQDLKAYFNADLESKLILSSFHWNFSAQNKGELSSSANSDQFLTDFVLLHYSSTLIVKLEQLRPIFDHIPFIRDIAVDKSYTPESLKMHESSQKGNKRKSDVLQNLDQQDISSFNEIQEPMVTENVSRDAQILNFKRQLQAPPPNKANMWESMANAAPYLFDVLPLWEKNIRGQDVRVAVFDSGIAKDASFFVHEIVSTDWTGDGAYDTLGHGTFVAGMIAGNHSKCPGLAPEAQIITFRVFNGQQFSYTSWFLDAFNYALQADIDVLNLSIGSPDFEDAPFWDKIHELIAAGIVVVSAIGNDGPLYGSLNNPAEMISVIGVGGIERDGSIARFSSRGMTTEELTARQFSPYGRVKPDIVTFSKDLIAPSHNNPYRCRTLSGTSVSSPVVAGAIALMISSIPLERRPFVVNTASVKMALLNGAMKLKKLKMYEQGAGMLNIARSTDILMGIDRNLQLQQQRQQQQEIIGEDLDPALPFPNSVMSPSLFPSYLDNAEQPCNYMWPHCVQPLYYGGLPVTVNTTVFNPNSIKSEYSGAYFKSGINGDLLAIKAAASEPIWPWSGSIAIHIQVSKPLTPLEFNTRMAISGRNSANEVFAEGVVVISLVNSLSLVKEEVNFPVRVRIIITPPRNKRILWDIFHSLRYPPAFIPRDDINEGGDGLDWLGDHPHTNFYEVFDAIISAGFFIEILNEPLICMSAQFLNNDAYGTLLLVDTEDFFGLTEIEMIGTLVRQYGINLIVIAEWYNRDIMNEIQFEDQNTRSLWTPVVGGSNIPALNSLLEQFGLSFDDNVVSGRVMVGKYNFEYKSGTYLSKAPAGTEIIFGTGMKVQKVRKLGKSLDDVAVGALVHVDRGRIFTLGDSNCLDTAHKGIRCHDFFIEVLKCMNEGIQVSQMRMFNDTRIVQTPYVSSLTMTTTSQISFMGSDLTLLFPHSRLLASSKVPTGGFFEKVSGELLCYDIPDTIAVLESQKFDKTDYFDRVGRGESIGPNRKYSQEYLRQRGVDYANTVGHEKLSLAVHVTLGSLLLIAVCLILVAIYFTCQRKRRFQALQKRRQKYSVQIS